MSLAPRVNTRTLPLIVTSVLFALLFGFGSVSYDAFFSPQVFLNLLIDNAFVMVVAIGMTFVILTGGIDLSVGSIVALTTMVTASLVEHHHWSIWAVVPLVLLMGSLFGGFLAGQIANPIPFERWFWVPWWLTFSAPIRLPMRPMVGQSRPFSRP